MNKPKTLLEKALAEPRNRYRQLFTNDEELDLALALVNGDIDMGQAARAAGVKTEASRLAYRAYACIRNAIAAGKIPRIERIGAKNGKAKP